MSIGARIDCPMVDVIVAVHNEAQMIAGKLRELETIDYPANRVRFIIVDGGSSDGTMAAITAHCGCGFPIAPLARGHYHFASNS